MQPDDKFGDEDLPNPNEITTPTVTCMRQRVNLYHPGVRISQHTPPALSTSETSHSVVRSFTTCSRA